MTEETNNRASGINYTVKELLADMKQSIDRIEGKLDTKVDIAVVDALNARIRNIESINLNSISSDIKENQRLIANLLTRLEANEAVKKRDEEINKIYLNQFEAMQRDVQTLKTDVAAIKQGNAATDSWKVLWIPIIANGIAVIALIYFTIIK